MSARWRWWWTPLVFLALAALWTWPAGLAALSPGDRLVGRHFDVPASLWFLGSSPRLLLSLTDPMTGWPDGVTYGRPDSFTVLALGWALQWLHPARVYGALQILGVAGTAWAAEAFAREVGARAPWSLLAGIAVGFCGLASTALLEGYVYHVLAPWLPLFALFWWRACRGGPSGEGTTRDGLLAGLMFSLTLLTTAYLGLAAGLLLVGFAAGGLLRRSISVRAWAGAAAVAVPAVGLYVAAFAAGGGESAPPETAWEVSSLGRSAHLLAMAGPTASQDRFAHSASATTPAVALCLALAAPVALRALPRWRALAATGFGALVLSMGPLLGSPELPLGPLPLSLLADLPGHELLRFPGRLGWAWVICGGALAGRVATELAPRAGRPALALFAFALVDLFLVERLPLRQHLQVGTTPSAYGAHEGPVLDLFPEELSRVYEFDAWAQARSCYHQLEHGRPIASDCVITRSEANPGWQKSRALNGLLLAGDAAGAEALLRGWDFETVALRPDFYRPGDRAKVQATLSTLDPTPAVSTDGGEHLVAYRVPP